MVADETELRRLMTASQSGDAGAYRILLEKLSRYLRGYYKAKLMRYDRDAIEAEDLVQEVLMAIHTRRHTYDPAQPFTPWMHAMARYKLVDYLRRSRAGFSNVGLDDVGELADQDDRVSVESGYDLEKLLARLPEKMRRAIQSVKIDGLSVAEAAERCGMSESAVKVNVHRGLKALADAISREAKT